MGRFPKAPRRLEKIRASSERHPRERGGRTRRAGPEDQDRAPLGATGTRPAPSTTRERARPHLRGDLPSEARARPWSARSTRAMSQHGRRSRRGPRALMVYPEGRAGGTARKNSSGRQLTLGLLPARAPELNPVETSGRFCAKRVVKRVSHPTPTSSIPAATPGTAYRPAWIIMSIGLRAGQCMMISAGGTRECRKGCSGGPVLYHCRSRISGLSADPSQTKQAQAQARSTGFLQWGLSPRPPHGTRSSPNGTKLVRRLERAADS